MYLSEGELWDVAVEHISMLHNDRDFDYIAKYSNLKVCA